MCIHRLCTRRANPILIGALPTSLQVEYWLDPSHSEQVAGPHLDIRAIQLTHGAWRGPGRQTRACPWWWKGSAATLDSSVLESNSPDRGTGTLQAPLDSQSLNLYKPLSSGWGHYNALWSYQQLEDACAMDTGSSPTPTMCIPQHRPTGSWKLSINLDKELHTNKPYLINLPQNK